MGSGSTSGAQLNSGFSKIIRIALCGFVLFCANGARAQSSCDMPADLKREIAIKYPDRALVTLSDLDKEYRDFFLKDHPDGCPGLVKVDFYGDGVPTFALELISRKEVKVKLTTDLVVARKTATGWKSEKLDSADGGDAVIWSAPPGKYKDVWGAKNIRASRPVIVFCGYWSWAVVYAWTGGKVAKVWLND
jgi:hypothetical protein